MNEPPAPRPKLARMTNYDGIRGIGISIVILYHLGYPIVNSGWVCISYFFSMSGFLITAMTVQKFESMGEINIVNFWSLRIGRLFPALFLTIFLCATSRFFRVEDEKEFVYERNDLLYGLSILTNYNLVFVRRDDYFAHFSKPSITRHMWSLAIEEQYYAIWPVIFYTYTRIFSLKPKQAEVSIMPKESNSTKCTLSDEKKLRRFLIALCVGEGFVMVLSHIASLATYSKLGVSAAYYSTWCRMGDLACGGLVFLLVRLHPRLYRRICNDPGMEPIQFEHRIVLELLCFLAICLIIFPATIRAPFETIFHYYIHYARFPMSFALYSLAVAGVLQISEPLPRWAIFSRALNSKVLTTLGSISYGVYLYHWPIYWFLGGSTNDETDDDIWIGYEGNDEKSFSIEPVTINTDCMFRLLLLSIVVILALRFFQRKNATKRLSLCGSKMVHAALWLVLIFCITVVMINCTRLLKQRSLNFALDSFIVFISILSGYVSYFWFELPLLIQARRSNPSSVVAAGFLGAISTAIYVVICFSNVINQDFIFDWWSSRSTSDVSGVGSLPILKGENLKKVASPDTRHTSVHLFAERGNIRKEVLDTLTNDMLDKWTFPLQEVQCEEAQDHALQCEPYATQTLYMRMADEYTENAVIIMCQSYSSISPCDFDRWKEGTKWIWLDSPFFCEKNRVWKDQLIVERKQRRVCPDKLEVKFVSVSAEVHNGTKISYTGHTNEEMLRLTKLIIAIESAVPGAINEESIRHFQDFMSKEKHSITHRDRNSFVEVGEKYTTNSKNLTTVLVMGESIAFRMALMFDKILQRCVEKDGQTQLDPLKIVNRALWGNPAIACFLPQNVINKTSFLNSEYTAKCFEREVQQRVYESIPLTSPDIVVVHDGGWADSSKNRAYNAMARFLMQALAYDVKHVFVLTNSASWRIPTRKAQRGLDMLGEFFAQLRDKPCSKNEKRLSFNVVKWHLLTCPSFASGSCSIGSHGFEKILPDGVHPSGQSGQWLCAQVLSLVLGEINYLDNMVESLNDSLEAGLSSCLLSKNAPDSNPPLRDLVETKWICEADLTFWNFVSSFGRM